MMAQVIKRNAELLIEQRRSAALKKAHEVYYDKTSPHYRDNERFSWAVKTINKGFDEEIENLN